MKNKSSHIFPSLRLLYYCCFFYFHFIFISHCCLLCILSLHSHSHIQFVIRYRYVKLKFSRYYVLCSIIIIIIVRIFYMFLIFYSHKQKNSDNNIIKQNAIEYRAVQKCEKQKQKCPLSRYIYAVTYNSSIATKCRPINLIFIYSRTPP